MYLRMYINNPAGQVYSVLEFITTFGTFVIVKIHRFAAIGTGLLRKSVDFLIKAHIVSFFKEEIVSQFEAQHEFSAFGAVKAFLLFNGKSINGNIADTEHNLGCRLEKV